MLAEVLVFLMKIRYKKAACFAVSRVCFGRSKLDFRFTSASCAFHSFFLEAS